MRLFLLTLLFAGNLLAQSLPPGQLAPLYLHLVEVNEQWLSQSVTSSLLEEVSFSSDLDRIQKHLELVEKALRQGEIAEVNPQQCIRRTQLLDALQVYWQQKRFPVNTLDKKRIPVFIDHNNTPCAVAALLLASNGENLAAKIRREDNYATLDELLRYPELGSWADDNGLSKAELKWIQPGYNFPGVVTVSPFGNNLGVDGGEVLDLEVAEEELFFAGNFTQIDGTDARYLAA